MQISTPEPHPTHSRTAAEEADVGSGERTPGQVETDNIIKDINRPSAPAEPGTRDTPAPADGAAPVVPPAPTVEKAERGAETASERDKAGHGQIQRESNRSRQSGDAGQGRVSSNSPVTPASPGAKP
ncbi:hypothetical protein [Massilia sp. H6]|uniref:hypothetical protein n=1 Tax=Massilia sp. H6 TaxID=2970464 RepID=UPI0021682D7E|nr:hypothetical protein [Massilia sp. H6]UVW30076.1 hypothetical protein NRS07_08135 [Massilia sp. H6]